MAIALHTNETTEGQDPTPVLIAPVSAVRAAVTQLRKLRARKGTRAFHEYLVVDSGSLCGGDPFGAGMARIEVCSPDYVNADSAFAVPYSALAVALKGARGSIRIAPGVITRGDGADVTYTVAERDTAETISAALRTASDYELPTRAFVLTGQQTCDVASMIAPHASTDQTRPVLTGIYVSPVSPDGEVDFVATDSYRLGRVTVQTESLQDDRHMLIPARTFATLASIVGKRTHASVSFHPDLTADPYVAHVIVRDQDQHGDSFTVARLRIPMETGQYPNYRALVPEGANVWAAFTDAEADQLVTFAGMLRDTNAPVVFTLDADGVTVERGGASLAIPCDVQGHAGTEPMRFALSAAFMADCIRSMPQGGFTLGIISPLRPFTFTAADPSQDYYRAHCILMPVRV